MRSFLLLLLALISFGCTGQADTKPVAAADSASKSVKAPDFTLNDLDGKPIALAKLKGKVVFVDFWATWCPPCVMSSPEVERLAEDYQKKGVEFVGLSMDSSAEPVRKFAKEHHLTSHLALATDTDIPDRYHVDGIPTFVIIDKKGNLVGIWSGFNSAMSTEWRTAIDKLLAS